MKNKFIQRIVTTGNSLAPLPLRLAMGAVFMAHGAQKLFGWFGGNGLEGTGKFFEGTLGLNPGIYWAGAAGAAEFLGGLLLLLGLFTRFGALMTGSVMVVAILLVHKDAFFVNEGGMEFALTLLAAAVALLITGGGAASLDRFLQGKA